MPTPEQIRQQQVDQEFNRHLEQSRARIRNEATQQVLLVEERPREYRGPKRPNWRNSDVFSVVKADDMELKIALGQRPLNLGGKLQTRDKREPSYEITVMCQVRDPRLFAQTYRQSGDPVHLARTRIDGALQEYARTKTAEELNSQEVYNIVLAWGSLPHHLAGLAFTAVNRLEVKEDELIALQARMVREQEVKKLQGQLDAELARSQQQHNLELTRIQQQHEQEMNYRLSLVKSHIEEALKEVQSGIPESEVLAKYQGESSLLQLFFGAAKENALSAGQGRPALAGPGASPVVVLPDPLDSGSGNISGPPRLSPPSGPGSGPVQTGTFRDLPDISSLQEVENSVLGVHLIPVVLGGREAEISRVASGSQALRISSIDPEGLGYRSGLRYGHILLKINGEPVTNPRLITPMLSSADSDTAQLEVFGDGQLLSLAIKM